MKRFSFLLSALFTLFNLNAFAHKGGHGPENLTRWRIDDKTVEATFLKSHEDQVFLETSSGTIIIYELSESLEKKRKTIDELRS
ncbi:hypothetical protein [Fulvivirga sp. M361]|uniref:hypothetical protein n=1 Tax=Fulvivirga sp. M361 TaxID=2594266 RepID=UPI0016298EA6|nr:hypothetical protein [Fulvivirga sp. M361]